MGASCKGICLMIEQEKIPNALKYYLHKSPICGNPTFSKLWTPLDLSNLLVGSDGQSLTGPW